MCVVVVVVVVIGGGGGGGGGVGVVIVVVVVVVLVGVVVVADGWTCGFFLMQLKPILFTAFGTSPDEKAHGNFLGCRLINSDQSLHCNSTITMEYASTMWGTAAKTNKSRLDKVQNMALGVILGALKTTPVHDMEKTANVEPLERRRSLKMLIQGEKLRRLPSHPLHTNLEQPSKNRLKRRSLNHQYKELSRTHQDIVDVPVELLTDPAWKPDRETGIQNVSECPRYHLKGTAPWRAQKPHACPDR